MTTYQLKPEDSLDHIDDEYRDQGHKRGLQRTVQVEWCVIRSDCFLDDRAIAVESTREKLVASLVELHGKDVVDDRIDSGDWIIRRRIVATIWADDEEEKPSLEWISHLSSPRCSMCQKPATCLGSYEDGSWAYGCDECCAHGCEDGHCSRIESEDFFEGVLETINDLREREQSAEDRIVELEARIAAMQKAESSDAPLASDVTGE